MTDLAERVPTDLAGSTSLVDGIRLALRSAIAQGSLPPGYRLREIRLAAHFECSTTPVREAIRKLEAEGLVRIYPRRGAEVTAFSISEVEHLYETRLVLETHAARKAARRRPTEEELAPVREVLARHKAAIDEGQPGPPVDDEFHEALTALAGNPVIAELAARLTRQIVSVQARTGTQVQGGRTAAYAAHTEILDAVAAGDARAAERLMREHLEWARDAVLATLGGATD